MEIGILKHEHFHSDCYLYATSSKKQVGDGQYKLVRDTYMLHLTEVPPGDEQYKIVRDYKIEVKNLNKINSGKEQ